MKINLRGILTALTLSSFILLCLTKTDAQTTSFTYQGKLTDNNIAANGSYQIQFVLFDQASGGNQLSGLLTVPAVTVTNGVFTVSLNFGELIFDEEDRYLQIAVFSTATNAFVVLTPRQHITSAPYAIRAAYAGIASHANNAQSLGNVAAANFVQTGDVRLTNSRSPTPGSGNYIQNGAAQQAASSFNVSGNGTAGGTLSGGTVNAATQYNLGGARLISAAGASNTFVGILSGTANSSGSGNSFFGNGAGADNSVGVANSFFGRSAGNNNSGGDDNSFYGSFAGSVNTNGNRNSFFGASAGSSNNTGNNNSFFGRLAGEANTNGDGNTFVGHSAGSTNTTGNNNTYIGFNAKGTDGITNAAAIGANAFVFQSNQIVVGTDTNFVIIPGNSVTQGTTVVNTLRVNTLGSSGSLALCRNFASEIGTCSSSLRYKTNIAPFKYGLNLVNRLKPITFDWKEGGMHDLGLGAEDVAAIEPLLVTYNKDGQVEGVKYDRIGVVLLNAVKEQQTQIEMLQKQNQQQQELIKQQQLVMENLKKLVCSQNTQAEMCREQQNEK